MRDWRLRVPLLLALTALPPAVEATVLTALHFRPSLGMSVLASAPAPYGSLHDMLWTLVYHESWPGFVAEFAAAVGYRGLFSAAAIALAWPAGVPRPPVRRLLGGNLAFAAICAVIVSPGATMAMAAVAVSLSWFVLGELVPLLLFAPVVQRGGICRGWWRGLPDVRLVTLALLNFVVLTVTGTLVWRAAGGWAVPAAAAAGAVNGGLWWYLVRVAVRAPVRLPRLPTVPVVVAVFLAGVLALGAGSGFGGSGGGGRSSPPPVAANVVSKLRHQIIFIAGYNSAYDGHPARNPVITVYSYRGVSPAGEPLPYQPDATHQALETSAAKLADEVDSVHRRTGQPVALVGLSEGALIAREYLDRWPHPDVDATAMVSPVVRPGQVYYPPPDAGRGWGLAAGWELRGILAVVGLNHSTPISADEPFVRSLLAQAPRFRNQMLCPVPGVRMIAFLPSADAATIPPGSYRGIPADDLPALHGGLLGYPEQEKRLVDFLNGTSTGAPQHPYFSVVQVASGVWQAPVLAQSVNPVWDAHNQPDAALRGEACPKLR